MMYPPFVSHTRGHQLFHTFIEAFIFPIFFIYLNLFNFSTICILNPHSNEELMYKTVEILMTVIQGHFEEKQ